MGNISTSPNTDHNNDNIDLALLIKNLWEERLIIFSCLILTLIGVGGYLFKLQPVYTANIELIKPNNTFLNDIKPKISSPSGEFFLYTPDAPLRQQQQLVDLITRGGTNTEENGISRVKAFSIFLNTLESQKHSTQVIRENTDLAKSAFNFTINHEDTAQTLNKKFRKVLYPNTIKKNNELKPDSYFLKYEGYDRESLKKLILTDIQIATETTNNEIRAHYISQLKKLLSDVENQQKNDIFSLNKRISAREWFLKKQKENKVFQLEEQIFIAKKTNDIKNTNFLLAQLETLKKRKENMYYDEDLLTLKSQKQLLENNLLIPQLNQEITRIQQSEKQISFSHNIVASPKSPIKPNQQLILFLSILGGIFLGCTLATIKSLLNNNK